MALNQKVSIKNFCVCGLKNIRTHTKTKNFHPHPRRWCKSSLGVIFRCTSKLREISLFPAKCLSSHASSAIYNPMESENRNNIFLDPLTAVSAVDGRYRDISAELSEYFSEYGLIR